MSRETPTEEQAIYYATGFILPIVEAPFTTDMRDELIVQVCEQLSQDGLSWQSIVEGTKRALIISNVKDKATRGEDYGIG